MKYNALHAPCDAKDNIDIRDSNFQREKNGKLCKFSCFSVLKGGL